MRNRILALMVTGIIAVVDLPLNFLAYREFYVKPIFERYPQALWPYIDVNPFTSTWYAISTLLVWFMLFGAWIVWLWLKRK